MIVEFIGCSGAGKTTLAEMVQHRCVAVSPVISAAELVMDRPGRRWIKHPTAMNLVADVTTLPSFLRALDRNGEFVRFAFRRLRRHAPSRFARYNYMREVARNVGKHELARRADANATVFVDEGAVLTAYHLFVYSDAPVRQADLDHFARLVPLPDRIVHVKAPLDVLMDRAMRRPDRRRELAGDDRRDVERWLARAIEVFEGLTVSPPIRDRILTVDNADGSPDARQALISRIAAFIGHVPATDQAVGSPVSPGTPAT